MELAHEIVILDQGRILQVGSSHEIIDYSTDISTNFLHNVSSKINL